MQIRAIVGKEGLGYVDDENKLGASDSSGG
jgi:hypothetical protein